jgi:hypothetical protein
MRQEEEIAMSLNLNPDGSFMSEDQIVDDIVANQLDVETRRQLLSPDFSPLDAHFGLGGWVRNTYGLWDEGNPHVGRCHPDDISERVVEKVVAKLRRQFQN